MQCGKRWKAKSLNQFINHQTKNDGKNLWRNTTVISGIRFFVRGTNLLTFSKFDLWDPEVTSDSGASRTGAVYPAMKSISAGFEIKF